MYDQGGGRRYDQHDEMLGPDKERSELEWPSLDQRWEGIEVARQDERRRLFDLHPYRKTRDHGGHRSSLAERAEAEALDIEACEHSADHDQQGNGQRADAEPQERVGAEVSTGHDGRSVSEVEPVQRPEDQGEAQRQQCI